MSTFDDARSWFNTAQNKRSNTYYSLALAMVVQSEPQIPLEDNYVQLAKRINDEINLGAALNKLQKETSRYTSMNTYIQSHR